MDNLYTDDLLSVSLIVLTVTFILVLFITKSLVRAAIVGLAKSGIFFVNYIYFFNGSVTGEDDLYYLEVGRAIQTLESPVFELIMNPETLINLAGSVHIGYPFLNYLAIDFFGDYYFAPAAINVMISIVPALLGMKLGACEFNFSRRQANNFFVFLMLYPDIVTWTTVFNGKEILVLTGHILLLTGVSFALKRKFWQSAISTSLGLYILSMVRFYVAGLFGIVFLTFLVLQKKIYKRKLIIVAAMFVGATLVFYYIDWLDYGLSFIISTLNNPIYGFIHFVLTPIPFRTDPEYDFLTISALYHWGAFPFFMIGLWKVYKSKTDFTTFITLYLFVFLIFYSVFDGLQGPRHRFQLDFAFALFEYIGFLSLFKKIGRGKKIIVPNGTQQVGA